MSVGGLVRAVVDARLARPPHTQRADALDQIETMRADLPEDPADLDCEIDAGRLAEASRGLDAPGAS